MSHQIDMHGTRSGRLTVVSLAGTINGSLMWECLCDCGHTVNVPGYALRRTDGKATRSCGCRRSSWVRRHIEKELRK